MSRATGEDGSALVLTMFALTLLTAIGVTLLFLSDTEVKMSRADVRSKQAFFLAEAGLEHARLALYEAHGSQPFEDALRDAAGIDEEINFDPDALARLYDSYGNPSALSGFGDDAPVIGLTSLELTNGVDGFYAAFLTNDPTESGILTDSNDRVMLTGIGLGPGRSFEMAQMIIEYRFLTPPPPPATITMPGASPDFTGGSSGAIDYSGTDCDGDGDPGIAVPTVGVFSGVARDAVVDGMGPDDNFYSGELTGSDTIVDLTDADNPLVTSETDSVWTDCLELRDLMQSLRDAADVVCEDSDCVLPAPDSDAVIFADGDFTASDGRGLLAVAGVLTVNGNWDWEGLVLVVGKGQMQRNGGGNGETLGAIVIANISGPDLTLFTDDDCSTGSDGFDDPTYDTSGGGNALTSYCQSSLDNVRVSLPYETFDFRQR